MEEVIQIKPCSHLVQNTPAWAIFRNGGRKEKVEEPPGPAPVSSLLLGLGKPYKRKRKVFRGSRRVCKTTKFVYLQSWRHEVYSNSKCAPMRSAGL